MTWRSTCYGNVVNSPRLKKSLPNLIAGFGLNSPTNGTFRIQGQHSIRNLNSGGSLASLSETASWIGGTPSENHRAIGSA